MESKTKIISEPNKQEIFIIREFEISVDLVFKAFSIPELIEEWMGTNVKKFDFKNHGSFEFETKISKDQNQIFHGTFHEVVQIKKIIRTFEMQNTHLPAQLEIINFEKIGKNTSKLNTKIIFQSINDRDELLKLPFEFGINKAHNQLEQMMLEENKNV